MSTRATIILKDEYHQLYFYRHSDGYPEVTGESLKQFMKWLEQGYLRKNVSQAGGWLILLGMQEYADKFTDVELFPGPICTFKQRWEAYQTITELEKPNVRLMNITPEKDWEIGAYEPATGISGDTEYVYVIDLAQGTLEGRDVPFDVEEHAVAQCPLVYSYQVQDPKYTERIV